MHRPLSPEEIAALSKPKPQVTRVGKSKPRTDFADRSYVGWFHFSIRYPRQCDFCPQKRMCVECPDGKYMCRMCFIEGKGEYE